MTCPVLRKMQNPGLPNGPPMVDGWVVHLSSRWSVNQKSAQTMKSIINGQNDPINVGVYLGISRNGHMITVESYVQFYSEKYFLQI